MVKSGRAQEYIDTYVTGPKDHMDYIERVGGMARMEQLRKAFLEG
jgi:hypothetical protein